MIVYINIKTQNTKITRKIIKTTKTVIQLLNIKL
jgi:hypothetical protein